MDVDVSPRSSTGDPLLGQWDSVKIVRAFPAPSTMTFGIAVVWLYGRNRMPVSDLHMCSGQLGGALAKLNDVAFRVQSITHRVKGRNPIEVRREEDCAGS